MIYIHFLKPIIGNSISKYDWKGTILIDIILYRLYTTDKGTMFAHSFLRGTGIFKAILENNVDLEKSFNSDLMIENTIAYPNSAIFYASDFVMHDCKVEIIPSIFFDF